MGHADVKPPSRQVHTELTLSRSVLTFFAWWFVHVAARSAFLVRRGLAIGLAFTLRRSTQLKTVSAAFVDCPEASEVSAVDIYCSYF